MGIFGSKEEKSSRRGSASKSVDRPFLPLAFGVGQDDRSSRTQSKKSGVPSKSHGLSRKRGIQRPLSQQRHTHRFSSRRSSVPKADNVRWSSASNVFQTSAFGRQEVTLRARRRHPYNAHTMKRPSVKKGTQWTDNTFPFTIDQDKKDKPVRISWKRPTEYASECRLFGDKMNRFVVKQGQVGDCFYISTLSAMADEPKLIKQVIPKDAYDKHSGVFHCRFWWMGEWIDVYTDDLLPFNENSRKVYGGRSDDKNIVWVPLMEKALARLCGSYQKVQGDQAHAFTLLTGGVVDKLKIIKRDASDEILPPTYVFARIQQALDAGSFVLTSIDQSEASNPGLKGLTVNHSYAIHDAIKVKRSSATTMLLRIRNPWGETNKVKPANENGDWKGRWSYDSPEWREASRELRRRHNVEFEKGGEFWVCMEDFYKIFEHIYIADTIPNFDEKGFRRSNRLNNVFNVLGDWHGETAAGSDWKTLFKNPRFVLVIPNKGLSGDNRMPTIIQLILEHEHPVKDTENKDHLYCRVDIFREEAEELRSKRLLMSLTTISVSEVYLASRENTRLHRLSPGRYILVPNFLAENVKRGISQAFCIRVFTATPVKCRELTDDSIALTGKPCETFENEDGTLKKQSIRTVNVFGEWRGETAAGSDSVNRLNNPRFLLSIPGHDKVKISFQLRLRRDIDTILHCRLDVFKIDEKKTRHRDEWMVMSQITNMVIFMAGGEVSYNYELPAGKYLLLPNYSGQRGVHSAFCIRILARTQVDCRPQTEFPVMFVRTAEQVFNFAGKTFDLKRINCVFGAWVKNETAGGQIRYETFGRNPQYGLTVEGRTAQPFLIELLQECVAPIHAIGCFVVKTRTEGRLAPLNSMALKTSTRVNTAEGNAHTFIQGAQSSGYYMLSPGRYLILVYADLPTDEKKFALVVSTQGSTKPNLVEAI